MELLLNNQKTSKSGNYYYNVEFQGEVLTVTVNPKFKKEEPKIPSFLMMCKSPTEGKYEGKGAVWRMVRKDGIMHQGNFLFNGIYWLADIKRQPEGHFVLTMQEQVLKTLDDL